MRSPKDSHGQGAPMQRTQQMKPSVGRRSKCGSTFVSAWAAEAWTGHGSSISCIPLSHVGGNPHDPPFANRMLLGMDFPGFAENSDRPAEQKGTAAGDEPAAGMEPAV